MIVLRLAACAGFGIALLAIAYYIGHEVGRMAPVREELRHARKQRTGDV